jgi:acetyl-CoA synthetase
MLSDAFIPHLERYESYEMACREFTPIVPPGFNLIDAACRRHQDSITRIALLEVRPAADNIYTFGGIDFMADKFANVLASSGIGRGDVVGVMLSQSAAVPVAHLGAVKVGALVVPLSPNLGVETACARLEESECKVLVIDVANRGAQTGQSALHVFVVTDLVVGERLEPRERNFWGEINDAPSHFVVDDISSDTPAFVFYDKDSGVGVGPRLFSHEDLIGQLPAFEMCNNLVLSGRRMFWTSREWSSIETVMGWLYPAWVYGFPVVAGGPDTQDQTSLLAFLATRPITNALLDEPEIRTLTSQKADDAEQTALSKIVTVGAMPDASTAARLTELYGTLNSIWGRAEFGMVSAHCARWFDPKPGSLGRLVPGRPRESLAQIASQDDEGYLWPGGKS